MASTATDPAGPERGGRGNRRRPRGTRPATMPVAVRDWGKPDSALLILATVAIVAALCVAIGRGAPVFDHGADPWALASGLGVAALVAAGSWLWLRRRTRPPLRLLFALASLAALVVVTFTVGAASGHMLNGRPLFGFSQEARVMDQTAELQRDLAKAYELDGLLVLDVATARARFAEFEPASTALKSISARWANTDPASFADAALAPVAAALASGANFEAIALSKARDLLTTDDSRIKDEVALNRQAALAELSKAGPKLTQVANAYGFTTSATQNGPSE
jgi:hypothetical protein